MRYYVIQVKTGGEDKYLKLAHGAIQAAGEDASEIGTLLWPRRRLRIRKKGIEVLGNRQSKHGITQELQPFIRLLPLIGMTSHEGPVPQGTPEQGPVVDRNACDLLQTRYDGISGSLEEMTKDKTKAVPAGLWKKKQPCGWFGMHLPGKSHLQST